MISVKSAVALFAFVMALALTQGCTTLEPNSGGVFGSKGKAENLVVNPKMPAAEGTVLASEAKNNNTLVDLSVKHLAPPQRVNPLATTYVVWEKELNAQTPARSLGALMIDKDLSGRIETITPLRKFEIFVTAEASGVVNNPSGERLLSATVSRPHP